MDVRYNTKIPEFENKIPDISNLATKILINKVENRIPDISNLVKKQTILKLLIFKINWIIIIMTNISILQNLIL